MCEKVGSMVKEMQIHQIISVFDLKRRGSDRSVFDIKVYTPLYTDRHMQRKPKSRYFRQYRNPGQDVSGIKGTYGHSNKHSPTSKFTLLDELVLFTLLEVKLLQMAYLLLLMHITIG